MPDNTTHTGVLEYVDLSGGFWKLVTETGKSLVLNLIHDDGQPFENSGQQVTVQGTVADSFGIGMTSDQTLNVSTWSTHVDAVKPTSV